MSEIYFVGGCFWGLEKYLASIHGVKSTQVGYANGNTESPTYEEVCHHNTGYAETVKVTYDPTVLTLEFLLDLYEDVSFFLTKEDLVVYSFPYYCENNSTENYVGLFNSVEAVDFCDVNNDWRSQEQCRV